MGKSAEYSTHVNLAENILSKPVLGILDTHYLRPRSNSFETLIAITQGNLRHTTSTTRLPTDESLGSSRQSRVGRVRKDQEIAGLCINIQNLRDAIRTAELAENRNAAEIARIRGERADLQLKVHLLMRA